MFERNKKTQRVELKKRKVIYSGIIEIPVHAFSTEYNTVYK